jgi:pyruvate kinase
VGDTDLVTLHAAESFLTGPELLAAMLRVRSAAVAAEDERAELVAALPDGTRASGSNLVHYLAIRQLDLRREQRSLARLGLSSLGRAEPHVLATIDATITRLAAEVPDRDLPSDLGRRGPTADDARRLLETHTVAAVGPTVGERDTRLMVTLPTEAATDESFVDRLVASGMSIARINAAHDDVDVWRAMAASVRRAAAAAGREVKVAVDLPGPKLRTGPLAPGAEVLRARPSRDELGRVDNPVLVRFTLHPDPEEIGPVGRGEPVVVPVDASFLHAVESDDELVLRDARGRRRVLDVVSIGRGACEAECDRTIYFTSGLAVSARRDGELVEIGQIGHIPATRPSIVLHAGETLRLRPGTAEGAAATRAADGTVVDPATISIEVEELFGAVATGDRIMLDDGELEGVATEVDEDHVDLEIVRPARGRLRPGKGVNLPDTALSIPGLTNDDVEIIEAMIGGVDLVAMSFVSTPDDVHRLHALLDRLDAGDVGVILKIERRTAMDNLPELLLATLSRPPMALMVARGDLAVEIGFDLLPELQEEILWFGAAAHTPVILATQVLESLAKRGAPTRAEVTDAAWASRAECVMLNKGPFIPDAMQFLDGLLTRMESRREKRTPMLRQLSSSLPWGASD